MIDIDLRDLVAFDEMLALFPDRVQQAASMAINQTAKREALGRVRRDMRKQINWKESYLSDPKKTGIGKLASRTRLEATIYARDRPTMLNRFRPNPNLTLAKGKQQRGVTVRVKPNNTKVLRNAFVVALGKRKNSDDSELGKRKNIAVMMRTKGGASEPPSGITHGGGRYISSMRAWLLYAPSIDQVMQDTAERNADKIAQYLQTEFLRQFERLGK